MKKFILIITCCFALSPYLLQAQNDPFGSTISDEDAEADFKEKHLPTFEEYIANPKDIKINLIDAEHLVSAIEHYHDKIHIIDARSLKEFKVSHIKHSLHGGYHDFSPNHVWMIDHHESVVVYSTTAGKRSLHIAQYMKMMGYEDVLILEEGLIGWKNSRQVVYNAHEKKTDKIHIGKKSNKKLVRLGLIVY